MSILHLAASAIATAPGLPASAAEDPSWGDNPVLTQQFIPAIGETLLMTFWPTLLTVALGVPLGLFLVQTGPGGLTPRRTLNQAVSAVVNILRSFPFIILIIALGPLTKIVVGTRLGWQAASFALVISAVPFFARLVESNIAALDHGKIEAAQMMGATNRQIRWGVQVRETLPQIVRATTVLAITVIGYNAMAGAVGGGGLGQMAINYGYNGFQTDVMIATVLGIIIIVTLIQVLGDMISRLVDHR
ncbi:MAG: methionine ABC transporter permease [Pauljensenia sp.]